MGKLEDVDRQFRLNGAKDVDEAQMLAVKEFLRCEMKIKDHVFKEMKIEKIFPPAKDTWDKLYVQFSSQASMNTIFSSAKYLRLDQRLVTYIPKQFYDRYRAIESKAYDLRHSDDRYKTRVKMGSSDLMLYKKKAGEVSWSVHNCTVGLPPVNLDPEVDNIGSPNVESEPSADEAPTQVNLSQVKSIFSPKSTKSSEI